MLQWTFLSLNLLIVAIWTSLLLEELLNDYDFNTGNHRDETLKVTCPYWKSDSTVSLET